MRAYQLLVKIMSQHLLYAAKACALSVRRIFEMNDEQVFKVFKPKRAGLAIDMGQPFPAMPELRKLAIAFGDSSYVALYRQMTM